MTSRASASEIGAAIEPGSIPQGGRQELEANLQEVVGGGGGGAPTVGAAPLPQAGGTLESLLGGAIGGDELPVTDGLSVGAGAPGAQNDPMLSDQAQKLRLIATKAASPMLRQSARNALRRMAGGEPV
jgi:hypothetical protein